MPKKILSLVIIFNLGAAICLLISLYINGVKSMQGNSISPHEKLVNQQRRVEYEYSRYINELKDSVVSVSISKDVQKLRRANLRKKYFLARKADVSQSTLRYGSYTVKKKGSDVIVRPVYETYKSKILWDKLLKIMGKQALISTNEMTSSLHAGEAEKFTQIINIFLKDSGLDNIEKPANFNEFGMLGENIFLYWDIIYKKCSASVRKTTGRTKCVRGIFTGEIDRSNSVRDFALEWQQKNRELEVTTEFGLLKKVSTETIIEAYWPSFQHSNGALGENINKFIEDRGSRFFKEGDKLALVSNSEVLPDTLLISKIEINEASNFPYTLVSLALLLMTILISFYLSNRY